MSDAVFVGSDILIHAHDADAGTENCSYAEVVTERGLQALEVWRKEDAQRGVAF